MYLHGNTIFLKIRKTQEGLILNQTKLFSVVILYPLRHIGLQIPKWHRLKQELKFGFINIDDSTCCFIILKSKRTHVVRSTIPSINLRQQFIIKSEHTHTISHLKNKMEAILASFHLPKKGLKRPSQNHHQREFRCILFALLLGLGCPNPP